jgi:hypothetical protein
LSVPVLQDFVVQVVGVWILDSVENKDLTLVDHAFVFVEYCCAIFTTDTLDGEQAHGVGWDPQYSGEGDNFPMVSLDLDSANSRDFCCIAVTIGHWWTKEWVCIKGSEM